MRHWLILGHLLKRAGTKVETTIDKVAPKLVPKPSSRSLNMFLESHWFVDAFCSAFDSLVVRFWFQLANVGFIFGIVFLWYVLRFLCILRARRIERVLLLNYFGAISPSFCFIDSMLKLQLWGTPSKLQSVYRWCPKSGKWLPSAAFFIFFSVFPQGGILRSPTLVLELFWDYFHGFGYDVG